MYWLIIFMNGEQRIIEAEDFYEIHNQLDSDEVSAVIHLKNCMKEPIYEEDDTKEDQDDEDN